MISIEVTAAFATGFLTAILPCSYPIIFGFLALLLGSKKKYIFYRVFTFFLGFSVFYIFLGISAGLLGFLSTEYLIANKVSDLILRIGGALLIIFGLILLRAIPLPNKLKRLRSLPIPKWARGDSLWAPPFLGVVFASGFSPCTGPVLAGILTLAGTSGSVITGGFLLFVFSIGIFVPVIILTILYYFSYSFVNKFSVLSNVVKIIAGLIFISIGLIYLFGYSFVFEILSHPLESILY